MEWGLYVKDGKRSQKRGLKMDKFLRFLFPLAAEEGNLLLQQPLVVVIISLLIFILSAKYFYILLLSIIIIREGEFFRDIDIIEDENVPFVGTVILLITVLTNPIVAGMGIIFAFLIFIRRVKKWK